MQDQLAIATGLGLNAKQLNSSTPREDANAIMALTATATANVQREVKKILGIPGCELFRSPSHRPNLHYSLRAKEAKGDGVLDDMARCILRSHPASPGIVYCYSRKETYTVAEGGG